MASKTEIAQKYLDNSRSNVDVALGLITDDCVLSRPMGGAVSGKDAIGNALRNPMGGGGFSPQFEAPQEAGDQVKVKANLPPGAPVPSLTWTFSFEGDKIKRIDVGLG